MSNIIKHLDRLIYSLDRLWYRLSLKFGRHRDHVQFVKNRFRRGEQPLETGGQCIFCGPIVKQPNGFRSPLRWLRCKLTGRPISYWTVARYNRVRPDENSTSKPLHNTVAAPPRHDSKSVHL